MRAGCMSVPSETQPEPDSDLPILYSFRRCPYAMRARLGIQSAGEPVTLREVVLRDKPQAFLEVSPDGTVPLLVADGQVISESLDIMLWALRRCDPEGWLSMPAEGHDLIARFDGAFKTALDRTKYATRYPDGDAEAERRAAMAMLAELEPRLDPWLFGARPCLVDMAILPFVRQFAMIDKARFNGAATPAVRCWLDEFLGSDRFVAIMPKLLPWQPGDAVTRFPFADPARASA